MKYFFLYFFILILTSCGYPDIDNVPEFNDQYLSDEELNDYCKNLYSIKKNIDKCILDYKNKN